MAIGDNVNTNSAPWLADWLLGWLVPATDREQIKGDLIEEFSLRAQSSNSSWSWYWGQTLRSLPPMVLKTARQGRWLRTFLVASGAYIAAGLMEFLADMVLLKSVNPQSLIALRSQLDYRSGDDHLCWQRGRQIPARG